MPPPTPPRAVDGDDELIDEDALLSPEDEKRPAAAPADDCEARCLSTPQQGFSRPPPRAPFPPPVA